MKSLIKMFMALAIVFVGLGSFASIGQALNPNLDVYEVRSSHILVKTRPEALKIRKEIMDGEITFENAAQLYSLCPSGQRGGDLGFFKRGDMVQPFSDVAFDLKPGQISSPVGTKFGWHLIKTVDRR